MCQVIPFTLPCCRRVYVSISRLPSCPASWPKSKCPPELCIQVRGTEPEARPTGVCWRCKAQADGKTGFEKDMLRPGIDKAYIVLGLEELGITGRRRQVEEGGHCWFCNARGGCKECGADEMKPEDQQSRGIREETPSSSKKRHREPRPEKERAHHKRVKIEKSEAGPSTPRSMISTPRAPISNPAYSPPTNPSSYPEPNSSMMWQPPMHSNSHFSAGYNYGASSPSQGMAPQQQTPPNQSAMFSQPGSGSWNPNNFNQDWQSTSYNTSTPIAGELSNGSMQYNASAQFVGRLSGGNYQYNASYGPVEEHSSGDIKHIDPILLQSEFKPDPELKNESSPPTQAPWNDDSPFEGNFEDLDENEMARIFENFNKEQTEKEQVLDQEGAQQSTYIDPKLLSSS
ncbi:hypothetical protein BDZ45DRAFT_331731 [Acephala macrosclerotiorum]|nr:hypothetical protein BDZ45DRAFT_331731 [Acephala macrosclerotiorum]